MSDIWFLLALQYAADRLRIMIISPRRRFAFVHIPKTGGTSFATAYDARAAADDILIGDTPKARRRKHRLADVTVPGRLWKHSTLADVGDLVAADYFVCTLVRNPWDRMVSYYHWLQTQSFDHHAVRLAQRADFATFLRDPEIQQSHQAWPASRYVMRADGAVQCAAFVRLEHAEDFAPVWDHLGFQLTMPLVNTSARDRDYRRYYRPEDADIVGEICAMDIAQFGYRFDG